jgi:hypothetical protein
MAVLVQPRLVAACTIASNCPMRRSKIGNDALLHLVRAFTSAALLGALACLVEQLCLGDRIYAVENFLVQERR